MEPLITPSGFTNSIVCTIQGKELYVAIGLTICLILINFYENRN